MDGLLPDTDLLALGLAWALGFLKAPQVSVMCSEG